MNNVAVYKTPKQLNENIHSSFVEEFPIPPSEAEMYRDVLDGAGNVVDRDLSENAHEWRVHRDKIDEWAINSGKYGKINLSSREEINVARKKLIDRINRYGSSEHCDIEMRGQLQYIGNDYYFYFRQEKASLREQKRLVKAALNCTSRASVELERLEKRVTNAVMKQLVSYFKAEKNDGVKKALIDDEAARRFNVMMSSLVEKQERADLRGAEIEYFELEDQVREIPASHNLI